jgi:hypothetical protein
MIHPHRTTAHLDNVTTVALQLVPVVLVVKADKLVLLFEYKGA